MYILTHMFTLLATDASGRLSQAISLTPSDGTRLIDIDAAEVGRLCAPSLKAGEQGRAISTGPLAGFAYVSSDDPGLFHLYNGGFLCAQPDRSVVADRSAPSTWETLKFVAPEAAAKYLHIHSQTEAAFAERVRALCQENAPVRLHFGCGPRRINGFLNIDKTLNTLDLPGAAFQREDQTDYFLFDFADMAWPIPEASVDYVYSEDFIEHIPQRSQIAFLAEAFRVLKPGGYHRVSTPCLAASMRRHSDSSKGRAGVYFGEFDKWEHIALVTRGFMDDVGRALGYRQVFFTAKSRGSSPYSVEDKRPWDDRDPDVGNIFADLLK